MSPVLPTDLVVVLPGIMGSTLRRRGHLVWAPSAGAVLRAIATFGADLTNLRLPDGIGDDHPDDGVEPVDLMPDLHTLPGLWTPVKGYDRLLDRLRRLSYHDASQDPDAQPGNLLPVAYDWRLSNRYNGQRLAGIVEPALGRWRAQGGRYADAQLVFVCHSMGGLVARWYVERCGGAAHTRKLILLGTPYRGAVKALDQLVNGVPAVIGPLARTLAAFARSLPSLHQLLPEYACIDTGGDLLNLKETHVPHVDTRMVADAMRFHAELQRAEAARPDGAAKTHLILGVRQPTPTTARLIGDTLTTLDTYRGDDLAGDATVPITGATPAGTALDSNTLRRVADKHGSLPRSRAALDEIEGILTSRPIVVRADATVDLRVTAPELVVAGDPIPVDVALPDGARHGVRITVTNERGQLMESRAPRLRRGHTVTTFTDLPPGAYTIDVTGTSPGTPVAPVSSDVLIWPNN